jgi:hypothetical protein
VLVAMNLFEVLPDELFKPLASPSRRFYADLLLSLHDKTFSMTAEAPKRSVVIQEVADFMIRWEALNGDAEEIDPATAREDRSRMIYQRLVDTGWLIEHRDRYLRFVDLDPDAAGLLHVLAATVRGEARTYGGAVIGVLSSLESAAANPAERSESLRNAIVASKDFMAHMRMVSVSLRKVEEKILRQNNIHDVFRSFFEEFVQKHLIADFKTLHTRNNPFRFRSKIIQQAREISSSPLTVMGLGEAYFREGRAPSPSMGQVAVLDDLAVIIEIFEATEAHLSAIDETASRIERRIANTAKYMDRVGRTSEASIIEAIKLVASMPNGSEFRRSAVLFRELPVGPPHMATPRREKPPVEASTVREIAKDPVYERFITAKAEFMKRIKITQASYCQFIERALGDAVAVKGSNLVLETVDDFLVFQRLRELPTIFDGTVAKRFEIEMLPSRVNNEWIECQDFVIKRKKVSRNA